MDGGDTTPSNPDISARNKSQCALPSSFEPASTRTRTWSGCFAFSSLLSLRGMTNLCVVRESCVWQFSSSCSTFSAKSSTSATLCSCNTFFFFAIFVHFKHCTISCVSLLFTASRVRGRTWGSACYRELNEARSNANVPDITHRERAGTRFDFHLIFHVLRR